MKNNDITFENIEEFVDYIIDEAERDEDIFVTVVAKYDEAKKILKDVMTYEDVNFESLQIESPIMDNYYDEFILSFWMNDGVIEIGCEKLKRDGKYIMPGGDVVFLFSDCNSKIIPLCGDSKLYFVDIDNECVYGEDCDCCCHEEDESVVDKYLNEDDLCGFSITQSDGNSYYTCSFSANKDFNKNDIQRILREFGF